MTTSRTPLCRLGAVVALAALCLASIGRASAQQEEDVTPSSSLPPGTPASYQLIVPVVGQEQTNWCWAASNRMAWEYDSPLPRIRQCEEANHAFGLSNCCAHPSSTACNLPDSKAGGYYSFSYLGTPVDPTSGVEVAMTWDQLRYQIWVINKPFTFGWNWTDGGAHVQVVTGYFTDPQGTRWVYVNNPDPVGSGDPYPIQYEYWVTDPVNQAGHGAHTHEGDWFDFTYTGTRLIDNLATHAQVPTNALTLGRAPDLAGTVIAYRTVPFTMSSSSSTPSISGSIQEKVVRETASRTLDFSYRVTNSPGSGGVVTQLTIQNFGGFAAAAAYRPDSPGATAAASASRDISGRTIQILLEPIAPGNSSHAILVMTNATHSNHLGTVTIDGQLGVAAAEAPGQAQVATDQPTD